MTLADRDAYLAFFRAAEALKDTFRNSWTSGGRRESSSSSIARSSRQETRDYQQVGAQSGRGGSR